MRHHCPCHGEEECTSDRGYHRCSRMGEDMLLSKKYITIRWKEVDSAQELIPKKVWIDPTSGKIFSSGFFGEPKELIGMMKDVIKSPNITV